MFGSQTAVAQRAARECGRCKKQNDGFPFAREKLLRTKRELLPCSTSPSPTMEQHSDFRFVVMIRNLGASEILVRKNGKPTKSNPSFATCTFNGAK